MSNAELKYNLFKAIDAINDSKVLNDFYNLISGKTKASENDWWDELSPSQKASVERGIKDVEAGRVYSHEEVMAKSNALIDKHKKVSK